MNSKKFFTAAIISLLLIISCSKSSSSNDGINPPPGGGSDNTINIGAANFSPATLTVKIGTTVTWKNNDNVAHTATSDNGTTFNTGDIAAGASKTYTTNLAGTFPYHCTYHPGMTGSLVVTN